ncbi:MAG: pentapeptide repeat-containing protein [Alphaproteobacteria bacterium]|nr:pentapeptide repeat-containing protein [Alphaproteobacteria bacterium]
MARAEEISRIARPIFIGLLVGCVYSWLTIATTTDARLLTNSASSPLPIIGTEIPIAGFYWVAPILLLGVYLYLHLYLQRLWTGLSELPAVFPDGRPLDKRVYPWLMGGLVRGHFKGLKDDRTLLTRVENWTTIALAWLIVPTTVLLFWGRYLPRHDWFGTSLQISVLWLAIAVAVIFYRRMRAKLRGLTRRETGPAPVWEGAVYLSPLKSIFVLSLILVAIGSVVVSCGAIEGKVERNLAGIVGRWNDPATWVPYAFNSVGYRTYADVALRDVSTKPTGWTGLSARDKNKLDKSLLEKARAELAQVKGAQLRAADLRYANATNAFLSKADLNDADLRGARLGHAALRETQLKNADLRGAYLVNADLRDADLQGAKLQRAHLARARLRGANLQETSLQGANLESADLRGAVLWRADLRGVRFGTVFSRLPNTNLSGANLGASLNLTKRQLHKACGDHETKLPPEFKGYKIQPCKKSENIPK